MEKREQHSEHISPGIEQNLYGVRLFLDESYRPEEVRQYIEVQEKTHLAEGLALQQRTVRNLDVVAGKARGFGGQSMVEVNQAGYLTAKKQYLKGDEAARCLMKRREHDVSISEKSDQLMAQGVIGEGFMVVTPYEEEVDDETARRLGFWPEYRRSYAWFYRKKSEDELECVDVSIDQSSLRTYKELLETKGVYVPRETQSHDLPAYTVNFYAPTEDDRDIFIDGILQQYKQLNNDPAAKSAVDSFEAVEFLDKNAATYLRLVVDVHQAIAESLRKEKLEDLVRLSASRALKELDCLDYQEMAALRELLTTQQLTAEHAFGLSTIIAAQRYGVWQAMSKIAGGEEDLQDMPVYSAQASLAGHIEAIRILDHIYSNTNEAAEQGITMPGCAGGLSFLQQNSDTLRSSIFSGEKYKFNKKMYCLVCQAPPKEGAKPKMCGPCGLCTSCDKKAGGKGWRAAY